MNLRIELLANVLILMAIKVPHGKLALCKTSNFHQIFHAILFSKFFVESYTCRIKKYNYSAFLLGVALIATFSTSYLWGLALFGDMACLVAEEATFCVTIILIMLP